MAKKKGNKKAYLKGKSLSFLKSKGFMFTAAAMIAVAVIVGAFSFAGGSKTRGRVFSWRNGQMVTSSTILPYQIVQANPDPNVYQQVYYTESKWNGHYLSVYTELTTPLLGHRKDGGNYKEGDIKIGDQGDDILALKTALKALGNFKVTKRVDNDKDSSFPTTTLQEAYSAQFAAVDWNSNTFDQPTSDFISTVIGKSGLSSSYGDYMKDGKLDAYEIARIFTLAADPGFIGNQTGVVFDYQTGKLLYNGATKTAADMDGTKWTYHAVGFANQPAYRSGKNDGKGAYYFTAGFWSQKTNPNLYSRSIKEGMKGEDVKALQSMLNYAKANHAGDLTYPKLALTGTYGKSTATAVDKYSNYYNAPQAWANRWVMAYLARELSWGIY